MEKGLSRPVWTGSISFGLVTIPVKLFTAVREKRLAFRTLHDTDKVPLKQKMVCPADGKEVNPAHMVKGFEISKDRFVIMKPEELEGIHAKATKAIEIQDFVELDEIDPIYFDRPYYVVPKPEGLKPYKLLLAAMQKTGRVGIARVVMHTKEYLAALRPLNGGLCMETMHFADEVVPADTVSTSDVKTKVDDRELKIAQQLIDSLTTKFNPKQYHDQYRERVMELIERKAAGEQIVTRPESDEEPAAKGSDLMAALEASLSKTRGGAKTAKPAPATSRRITPARSHAAAVRTPRRRKSA